MGSTWCLNSPKYQRVFSGVHCKFVIGAQDKCPNESNLPPTSALGNATANFDRSSGPIISMKYLRIERAHADQKGRPSRQAVPVGVDHVPPLPTAGIRRMTGKTLGTLQRISAAASGFRPREALRRGKLQSLGSSAPHGYHYHDQKRSYCYSPLGRLPHFAFEERRRS